MNRRTFNQQVAFTGLGALLAPGFLKAGVLKKYDRIGMSTVNFRERFVQTQSPGVQPNGGMLTLFDIPGYFKERFKLTNVEFWSKHFESIDEEYLTDLKAAIQKSGSRLINIQFDEDYQIGSEDPTERAESLELALKWVEAAKFLGSGAIRVNPGNGKEELAIESLKQINEACKKAGLILMVENHFGMEMDPDVLIRIVKALGVNAYSLPDYGNYNPEKRYDSLTTIMPYAYQVSAKTMAFDDEMNHTSYDFDRCMKIAVDSGFKGIYSVEQWSRNPVDDNEEVMADWMISRVKKYL